METDYVMDEARQPHGDATHKERHQSHRHRKRSSGHGAVDEGDDSRRHRNRHRSHREKRPRRHSPPPVEELKQAEKSLTSYFIDVKGDRQNIVYGSIHRYDVPSFYRIGGGRVIGAGKHLRMNRDMVNDGKGIMLEVRVGVGTGREKYVFSRLEKKGQRLLRVLPQVSTDLEQNADYIPITKTRKRATESESEDASDDSESHYRSIEGKAKPDRAPPDRDFEYISDSDSSGPESARRTLAFDKLLRQTTIDLSRAVEQRPRDVEAWFELIRHQDSLLGHAETGRRKVTAAEKRSTADIKIHLYEKALHNIGSDVKAKERLLLGLMEEGAKFWDYKTQSEKWKRVSQENMNSLLLWRQYLNFQQGNFNAFQYDKARTVYVDRIRLLKKELNDVLDSPENRRIHAEHLIYALLRATILIRQSGYTELAVAIWQGLLELNAPGVGAHTEAESLLKEFWESELPRIGEAGASGLLHFTNNRDTIGTSEPSVDAQVEPPTDQQDLFGTWLMAEQSRTTASRQPARTMDEVAEDDPFRVILWSDVEDFVVDFAGYSSAFPAVRQLLCDAFLMFCGLPPMLDDCFCSTRQWWNESFVRDGLVNLYSPRQKETSAIAIPFSGIAGDPAASSAFDDNAIPSPEVLFARPLRGAYLKSWIEVYGSNSDAPIRYEFVRNVIDQVVGIYKSEPLAEYMLAFEVQNRSLTVKKTAKQLLKIFPGSSRLYNDYALAEAACGNWKVAQSVLEAALSTPIDSEDSDQKIDLWKTWTWLSLDAGDLLRAYKCLLTIPSGQVSSIDSIDVNSPTLLLKCNQYLTSRQEFLVGNGKYRLAYIYSECLVLLTYVGPDGAQRNIDASITALQKYIHNFQLQNSIPESSLAAELLCQSAARLLQYHITNSRFYTPAIVRSFLEDSLASFPQNTMLLSLYAFNERHLRIEDRVRSLLIRKILDPENDCMSSRLFAIAHEISNGNVHSLRAAFENAVESRACASNASLWKQYVLFCKSTKEYRKQAVDVFYRGMRACPWSKQYMMVVFEELRDDMAFGELRGVYKLISEKELRLHVDLEDRLDEWDEARKPKRIER